MDRDEAVRILRLSFAGVVDIAVEITEAYPATEPHINGAQVALAHAINIVEHGTKAKKVNNDDASE